ncbi:MAG: pyruvate ferredoxin oxidoreductase [archaeon]|nr:pyruvate ferredoxin oxidoreductase [archaeon]
MITEIIVLGRGGQGGVTGAEIIAEAAFLSKNYKDVSSFPTFGTERRGSPVQAFTRISSDETIWTRQHIYNPDIAVVLDETIMTQEFIDSIKPKGILIVNTDKNPEEIASEFGISSDKTIATSDITNICVENDLVIGGQPMLNTPILGVLSKVLNTISMDAVEKAIISRFGEKKGKLNADVANIARNKADIKLGGS